MGHINKDKRDHEATDARPALQALVPRLVGDPLYESGIGVILQRPGRVPATAGVDVVPMT